MKEKKNYYIKKWLLQPTTEYLSFFYTANAKASYLRKLRRVCRQENLDLWILPSANTIPSFLKAQGPSIGGIFGFQPDFFSYKKLAAFPLAMAIEKNRAYPPSWYNLFL